MKRKDKIIEKRNGKYLPIILIGIAIILGYAIYSQHVQKQPPVLSPNSTQQRLLPANLTDDEHFILNPPSSDASRSAKDKHAQTVAKLAIVGSNIQITNCKPSPLVLQVKLGSEFTITNKDSTSHNITFDEEHTYKVSANGNLTIKAEFKYGAGDYGYVCEGVGLVGFIHVAP